MIDKNCTLEPTQLEATRGALLCVAKEAEVPDRAIAEAAEPRLSEPTELTLREREQRLSSILGAVPVGIGMIVGRTIMEINDEICRISGYERAECIGKNARFLYPSDQDHEAVDRLYRRLLDGDSRAQVETHWRRKDGTIIDVVLSAAALDQRAPGRGATVAVSDITERKRADEAIRAAQALLTESQRAAQIGSWVLDLSSERLTWTEECFRIYGRAPDSFQPSLALFQQCVLDEDRAHVQAHFQETLATMTFKPFEARIRRPDGAVRWLHIMGMLECDEQGHAVRMFGTQQDVTDRKRSEEERIDLERRLLHAQKLESLGVLAGGIAHDFNNLLMAILGNLDLASFEVGSDSRLATCIDQALRAARRAADLTQQMLAYSGKSVRSIGELDLSALVEENVQLLRIGISKLVSFHSRLDWRLPRIMADAGQIQQVVMNLVTNAAEAIGDCAGHVTLTTGSEECDAGRLELSRAEGAARPGRFVFLEVQDTGCGMDEATQQRLFDPFFTTKFAGRGLGMSAILGIVRGHQGAIFVESALGKGTRIRVSFPCDQGKRVASAPAGGAAPGQARKSPSKAPGRGAILVVEDEESVRNVCALMLRRLGWNVITAADGPAALAVARDTQVKVACVILDLSMPRMDGAAVFRALRVVRPDWKVLLSSGYSSDLDSVRDLMRDGLAGFIHKPYDLAVLSHELDRVFPSAGA